MVSNTWHLFFVFLQTFVSTHWSASGKILLDFEKMLKGRPKDALGSLLDSRDWWDCEETVRRNENASLGSTSKIPTTAYEHLVQFTLTHCDWSVWTDWRFSLVERNWSCRNLSRWLTCVPLNSSAIHHLHIPSFKEFLLFIFSSLQGFFFPITIWNGSFLCNNTGHESSAYGPSCHVASRHKDIMLSTSLPSSTLVRSVFFVFLIASFNFQLLIFELSKVYKS